MYIRQAVRSRSKTTGSVEPIEPTGKWEHKEYASSLHPTLVPQVEQLFNILSDEEKDWIVQQTEDERLRVGMTQFSPEYNNWFMNQTIHTAKTGIDYPPPTIGARLKEHWNVLQKVIVPYNPNTGTTLKFERYLGIQAEQNVFLVTDSTGTRWVLKWESEKNGTGMMKEEENYRKIQAHGGSVPNILSGFLVVDFPVLVIEFLYALDVSDNPLEVGRQLLRQLKHIHKFALHLDLKPDNVRKRLPSTYFIIDMDLCTRVVACAPGIQSYRREHWTPYYASTDMDAYSIAYGSYRQDLIELFYVMNELALTMLYNAKLSLFRPSEVNVTKKSFGLADNMDIANVELMRKLPVANTAQGERAIRMLLRRPVEHETLVLMNYMQYVKKLPEYSMPDGVHDVLADSILRDEEFARFLRDVKQNVSVDCAICGDANVQTKCGDCYGKSTYLCTRVDCKSKHTC